MKIIPNLYEILAELDESIDYTNENLNFEPNETDLPYPYTLAEFYKYLIKSHCAENLEFFNKTRKFLISEKTATVDKELWNKEIFKKFIATDSPLQCNFPQFIIDILQKCYEDNIKPTYVDIVKTIEIVMGMLVDAYSRFLNHIQSNETSTSSSEILELLQDSEDLTISNPGVDIEQLNESIAHMNLTNRSLDQKKKFVNNTNKSLELEKTAKQKKKFLGKSKSFFHRFQQSKHKHNNYKSTIDGTVTVTTHATNI